MGVKKLTYYGQTLFDCSAATATEADVAEGKTFIDKAGDLKTGTNTGGSTPDYACLYKEVRVASAMTSGTTTWATAAELVEAGILTATNQEMTTQWNHYSVEVSAIPGTITHKTKQIVWQMATDGGSPYNGSNAYKRFTEFHNTSTTSTSTSRTASVITYNSAGNLYSSAANGIQTTATSTYGIGIATYAVKIACWGHK